MSSDTEGRAQHHRKACDLCFAKKIKCNMVQPECSNCILYKTECRTSTIRHRGNPPRPRPAARSAPNGPRTIENVKERLNGIEKQLERIIENTKASHAQISAAPASPRDETGSSSASPLWRFDPVEPSLYQGPSDAGFCLPPLNDIMPIIDHYFDNCNSVLPLFSQACFMRLVIGWYAKNPKREKATWAAILVVIALGLRSLPPGNTIGLGPEDSAEHQDNCLRNAQSVMSELAVRDEDLLGIQVLLALVLLYYDCSDGKPASVLIGMAMKVAHRLQLQSIAAAQHYSAEEVQQRSRVFWIAYAFDKNISLRTKTPSVQLDADIDVPLPPVVSPDGLGLISSADGKSQINFFRLRVELAYIEGKVYDLLYSVRSIKVQGDERQRRVASLQGMLDRWYARIPVAFQIDNVLATLGADKAIEMTILHHKYLLCIVSTHGIYSIQAEWMRKVSSLSKVAIRDFSIAVHGPRVITCTENQNPPLASGWNHCVDISRGAMRLFQGTTPMQSLIWKCSCAHFSALIIVLSNILVCPTDQTACLDLEMATRSIRLFEQLFGIFQSSTYEPLQRIITELYQSATIVVGEARRDQLNEADEIPSASRAEDELDLFNDETVFPEFEWGEDFGGTFNPFAEVEEESSLFQTVEGMV